MNDTLTLDLHTLLLDGEPTVEKAAALTAAVDEARAAQIAMTKTRNIMVAKLRKSGVSRRTLENALGTKDVPTKVTSWHHLGEKWLASAPCSE